MLFFGNRQRRQRLPPFDISRAVQSAPYRVVFLTEHVDATYYAYFHYVFESLADDGKVSFYVLSARGIEKHGRPAQLAGAIAEQVDPHLVVFVRYALPYGNELLRAFQARRVRTLYHLDDDLLTIPSELGDQVGRTHGNPAVRAERERLLSLADAILPSTVNLATLVRARVPSAMILPPLPPPFLGRLVEAKVPLHIGAKPIVGYMASKSHGADLDLILPAIRQVLDRREDTRFEIFGTLPMPADVVQRYGTRVGSHPAATNYGEFLVRLSQLSWSVGLAPLLPIAFNQCKSAIKFLEYTACGIPAVVSQGDVYSVVENERSGLVATDEPAWVHAILRLIDDRDLARTLVERARHQCENRFALSRARSTLLELLARV